MIKIIALALVIATPGIAQAQVGRGPTGGICFGAECEHASPDTGGGTNAFGGTCLGAYCNPVEQQQPQSGYRPDQDQEPQGYHPY